MLKCDFFQFIHNKIRLFSFLLVYSVFIQPCLNNLLSHLFTEVYSNKVHLLWYKYLSNYYASVLKPELDGPLLFIGLVLYIPLAVCKSIAKKQKLKTKVFVFPKH